MERTTYLRIFQQKTGVVRRSKSLVYCVISRFKADKTLGPKSRNGRPLMTTKLEDRMIIKMSLKTVSIQQRLFLVHFMSKLEVQALENLFLLGKIRKNEWLGFHVANLWLHTRRPRHGLWKKISGYKLHNNNLITTHNNDMSYQIEAEIDNVQRNRKFRFWFYKKKQKKTVYHLISKRRKLAQREQKTIYNCIGKVFHRKLCKRLKYNHTTEWYIHEPEPVLKMIRIKFSEIFRYKQIT